MSITDGNQGDLLIIFHEQHAIQCKHFQALLGWKPFVKFLQAILSGTISAWDFQCEHTSCMCKRSIHEKFIQHLIFHDVYCLPSWDWEALLLLARMRLAQPAFVLFNRGGIPVDSEKPTIATWLRDLASKEVHSFYSRLGTCCTHKNYPL